MRRRAVTAMMVVLSLGMITGCAPGDISRYAERAQQAGEVIFEGKVVPAAADNAAAESAEGTLTEAGTTLTDAGNADTAETPEAAGQEEDLTAVEMEDANAAESTAEAKDGTGTEADREAAQSMAAAVPAMMTEVPQNVLDAFAAKAEQFSGNLAGRDGLSRTEKAALLAVLQQESYDGKTLCLQNAGQYDGKTWGSWLLFFGSASLTARDRVRGDLWFFDGGSARKVERDVVFTRMRLSNVRGNQFLLTQKEKDSKMQAQVYGVQDKRVVPYFENAVSVTETGDGLCVSYDAAYFQYDPLVREWSGAEESIPYFYEAAESGFVLQPVKRLTAEEYLAYIPPSEGDAAAFRERMEEKFYTTEDENGVYSYRFFALGENRIGYQEQKKGRPDGISHAVAEYRYGIFELTGGLLTADSTVWQGKGFYFENPKEKEQELAEWNEIPARYQQCRMGSTAIRAAEKQALAAVCSIQEYPADALCFISAADYDGDGRKETFVAAGGYDGAFGAPICDLWYVGGAEPKLLVEGWPMKDSLKYEMGKNAVQLFAGYEISGVEDQLFSVKNGAVQRCLPKAGKIEIQADKTLMAWTAGTADAPGYYRLQDGETQEYGLQEIKLKSLLDYENGAAVYKRFLSQAGGEESRLTCLRRDNGLIHVMLQDTEGKVSYETWRAEGNSLILSDCGAGGYHLQTGGMPAEEKEAAQALNEENDEAGQEVMEGETD